MRRILESLPDDATLEDIQYRIYVRQAIAAGVRDLTKGELLAKTRSSGNNVVMNTGCPVARGKLEDLGFNVYETPLDEFLKAGGSAKCLTLIMG